MRLLPAALVVALATGCGGAGSHWVKQSVPAPGLLTVYSLWVAGEDDVWLGGSSIWHDDGSGWTETAPPAATPVVDFWGVAPDDLWAISDSAVIHWDGSAWTLVPPTGGVVFESLHRVWGASSHDLWIANTDNSRVYHYDGSSWTRTTLQFVAVDALWGSSGSDIWLTGTGSTYHYDGATWSPYQAADDPHGGDGLWGFGPDDLWVAGGFDSLSHWDGSGFTPVADEQVESESYNGVWGDAPDDVYAVGDHGVVSHYDGAAWTTEQALALGQNFTAVRGSSADNVWATAVDLQAQTALVFRRQP